MYANVQLRIPELGTMLPEFEWQVVDEYGWIQCRSEFRDDCVDYLCRDANKDFTYTLKRVPVVKRDPLSSHAKAAMSLIVERHGRTEKINCIKDVRAIYGVGLKEAKDLVEDYIAGL